MQRLGASHDEWFLFAHQLGQYQNLLPAVANPSARISTDSKLKSVGKTPSVYGKGKLVWGLGAWTDKYSTVEDIDKWSKQPDYSICVIGREMKALDFDITDNVLAHSIRSFTREFLKSEFGVELPQRQRAGSPKTLMMFYCPHETLKRVIKAEHGIIEFLGDRQQFLVAGTHQPSGVRYEWGGLDAPVPELTLDQFEQLWASLQNKFGVAPEIKERERKALEVDADEPILKRLNEKDMVMSKGKDGSYNIHCPFGHEHNTESVESSTIYWPAHTGGYTHAAIKCLHAHCAHRTTEHFKEGLGFSLADGFDDISRTPIEIIGHEPRFKLTPALQFANDGVQPAWLVKNLIPAGSLGLIYGASGAGKTFVVFDLIASISRGLPWRGRKCKQGRIVYICAEGAYFFRKRVKAYQIHHNLIANGELPVYVLDGNPNLMEKVVIKDLVTAIKTIGEPIAAIVVDTYANCMIGDENSGADAGKIVSHCKKIMFELDTTVILVHHAGKDANKGARGWSGLRAAVDFEFMVSKEHGNHVLRNTKQKDGEDGIEFGFSLFPVRIGTDDDGEVVESCVVAESKIIPLTSAAKLGADKINERESHIFNKVQELYEASGEWPLEIYLLESVSAEANYRDNDVLKALNSLVDKMLLDRDFDGCICLPKR